MKNSTGERINEIRSLQKLCAAARNSTSSGIMQFENDVRPDWPSNTAGVVASAVFCTKLHRLLTYRGMQPAIIEAIWCGKYSPGPIGECVTAVKEEEEEEEKTKHGKSQRRSLHVGTPLLGSKVI